MDPAPNQMMDAPSPALDEALEASCGETDGDEMDGDHASALASAGFGTDEDYGGGTEYL